MATAQSLLDLVDAEITRRLSAGAWESYSDNAESFTAMSLDALQRFRKELKAEIAAESTGTGFKLFEPFNE